MPVIDSRSDAKFDALVRTNKADALMSFIMATSNVKTESERKGEVAKRVKSAYELFRENIRNSSSGAGSYGDGSRDILEQFESHYTMGYEMGIWYDSDYHLNQLATKVSNYEITVSEYIGIVFLNLFSYFNKNGNNTYHHFLYEILNKAKITTGLNSNISKIMIAETLPIEKSTEQANIIFNYLVDTDLFVQVDNNTMKLSGKWYNKGQFLLDICNLEYKELSFEEAKEKFKDKKFYSEYVTQLTKESIIEEQDAKCVKENIGDYLITNINEEERLTGGTNTLLYGVPGSGKSHTIESNYCNDFNLMERVVFHPDYMNTDFVGQILPTVRGEGDEKEITYDFTPGPFTRVLKKAMENPNKHFYLVIEEINRGNAPAIFGEIFQLLDRDATGTSSYKITNYNIASEVFGKKETPIYIPSNLSILATMNTADQNVFTLDTAFQRRWNMKMIENDVRKAEHAMTNILDTSVTWGKFNTVVNEQIITSGSTTLSSEDKRLGAYFVIKDILEYYSVDKDKDEIVERYDIKSDDVEKVERVIKDLNSRFGDKVIKYLWDDAFKFGRDDLFESSYKSLEKVLDDFSRFNGDKKFDIFNQDIKDNLFTTEESR